MTRFRALSRRLLLASVVLLLFASPGPALAQQDGAATGEAVIQVQDREIVVLRTTREPIQLFTITGMRMQVIVDPIVIK